MTLDAPIDAQGKDPTSWWEFRGLIDKANLAGENADPDERVKVKVGVAIANEFLDRCCRAILMLQGMMTDALTVDSQ